MGERDENEALPWDKIEQANYKPIFSGFESIIEKSKARIEANEHFQLITENAKWIYDRKDINSFSLKFDDFKKESETSDAYSKRFKGIANYHNKLKFNSLPAETALFDKDELLKEKRQRWYDDMEKDIYIDEGVNVLSDLKVYNEVKPLAHHNKKKKLVRVD